MRLSVLQSFVRWSTSRASGLARKKWVKVTAASLALIAVVMTTAWTARYAWAIYRLNRGVGDTVFLDGYGREWFRLDEARRRINPAQVPFIGLLEQMFKG